MPAEFAALQLEQLVSEHYGQNQSRSCDAMLQGLQQAGVDLSKLTTRDLAPLDELHLGGRPATEYLFSRLGFATGTHVLDIGCGLGGPARVAAELYNILVTGIDITPEFCDTAEKLSEKTGLDERTRFEEASALDLPYGDEVFNAAYTIHAAMNIADKLTMYEEAHRVLNQGALLGIYDVMAGSGHPPLTFPVPWAETQATSFLATPDEVQDLLADAGFDILEAEDLTPFALSTLVKRREMIEKKTIPTIKNRDPKNNFDVRLSNLEENIRAGRCGPWLIIGRKR